MFRMKLGGGDQLLPQVGRGVDEKPMCAVGAERDRGLRAPQFRLVASRGPAHLATAIPLWNAAARRSAQDDDAKHDPSPRRSLTFAVPRYYEGGHQHAHVSLSPGNASRPKVHL